MDLAVKETAMTGSVESRSAEVRPGFQSILFPGKEQTDLREMKAPPYLADLSLDQIIDSVTSGWKEYDLSPFFFHCLKEVDQVTHRQDVMRDLEREAPRQAIRTFSAQMQTMRERIDLSQKRYYEREQQRWFLDGVESYCDGVEGLRRDLQAAGPTSAGLRSFTTYLEDYTTGAEYEALAAETKRLKSELTAIQYSLVLKANTVTVRPFEAESDYAATVERVFERFRRSEAEPKKIRLPIPTGMNHIEAQILDRVALLNEGVFSALQRFSVEHADFLDTTIRRFDREIQFYVAYLSHTDRFRNVGMTFCYPRVSTSSKAIVARQAFDLALAEKCFSNRRKVVCNDVLLQGAERILVVSGPNQGGKTTFARMFGQLHHLASLGCPVPGDHAELFLFDRIFSHFEREEAPGEHQGKLADELLRIRRILEAASPRSIVILNEIFASTTVNDAVWLSEKVMSALSELDLLGVCVTFLDELASFNGKTVSMVSLVDPDDPARRTFKVVRRPADGRAYALAIAHKYRLTYDAIRERVKP